VRRIDHILIIERERKPFGQADCVIGLDNSLGAVIEPAVANQNTEPSRGDVIAVIFREGVDDASNAKRIIRPSPSLSLDRDAAGEAAVNVAEGRNLIQRSDVRLNQRGPEPTEFGGFSGAHLCAFRS
jgi:hypothetical protein